MIRTFSFFQTPHLLWAETASHSSRAGLFYFKVLCLGIEMHRQKFLLDQSLPRLGLRFGEEESRILICVCVGRVRGQWLLL